MARDMLGRVLKFAAAVPPGLRLDEIQANNARPQDRRRSGTLYTSAPADSGFDAFRSPATRLLDRPPHDRPTHRRKGVCLRWRRTERSGRWEYAPWSGEYRCLCERDKQAWK